MEKSSTILYIGNNLSKKTKYNSAMHTLSVLLTNEGFEVHKSSDKSNKLIRILDMCFTVIKRRKKTDYVLIDTFSTLNFYYALIVSQLCRILNMKYVAILHGGNLPERLKRNKVLCEFIFKNAYKNVAPSMYLKTHFDTHGYKTIYIPNTIQIKEYPYKERKINLPNVLWVRAFDKPYNPEMAIEVLHLLKKKYANSKLCMVGPVKDNSFKECKKLAEKYSISSCITFTGVLKKEEWWELSKNYDVFINTTNIDNTPVSVIEAMALGIPIVSTNIGGIPFLIEDHVDGLLVPKNDSKEMANAISKIVEGKTSEIAKNARSKAESFDWEYVKEKWKKILV